MKWTEVSIHTSQEAVEAISSLLHEAGAGGVVIEDPEVLSREWDRPYGEIVELSASDFPEEGVIIKGYILLEDSPEALVQNLRLSILDLRTFGLDVGVATIVSREVDEDDWATAWKKYYKPVRVSNSVTVSPSWEEYEAEPNEKVIRLDPGMAFGTGTHPTTVLCIRALEKVIHGGENVIDVGCGTGVLSIAAAKLGAGSILALDLDQVAVESATLNVEMNGVSDQVTVRKNDLLQGVEGQYELIVANILAEVIVTFGDQVAESLRPGGTYITSGIISGKADMVKEALEKAGLPVEEMFREEDWVAFISKKV
jgi:ribosomal protein L11 methyltransferase